MNINSLSILHLPVLSVISFKSSKSMLHIPSLLTNKDSWANRYRIWSTTCPVSCLRLEKQFTINWKKNILSVGNKHLRSTHKHLLKKIYTWSLRQCPPSSPYLATTFLYSCKHSCGSESFFASTKHHGTTTHRNMTNEKRISKLENSKRFQLDCSLE